MKIDIGWDLLGVDGVRLEVLHDVEEAVIDLGRIPELLFHLWGWRVCGSGLRL